MLNTDLPVDPPVHDHMSNPSADPGLQLRLAPSEWAIFAGVLLFYAATRVVGIVDFPIFFFCDEAHQANLAHDLVANGLRGPDGTLCPMYFLNVHVFNLGLSVWIHALPVSLFGKTIFTVRATSVVIGLIGVAALMLALKWFFKTRLWWVGGLVMASLPAWFLHSRTAFETSMMVGFYATFVLAYLLYREVSAWWLSAAIVAGAATFYSYSNGQGVMFVTCCLLLVVDWRYHWQVIRRHPRATLTAFVVLLAVAAPYLRFRYLLHPEMVALHLQDLESYWVEDTPLLDRIRQFATYYLGGLGPAYWFTENADEIVRHRMLGYPNFHLWLAPAMILGLAVSLLRMPRSPAHRLVIIGMLAAPFSASLVGLRITRLLAMVVPATLSATIGLDQIRRWLRPRIPGRILGAVIGLGLALATVTMARDAIVNGPRWFSDYGMYGMQWGAKELFAEIEERLAHAPADEKFVITHSWANYVDAFGVFFLEPEFRHRIRWAVIDDMLVDFHPDVAPTTVFVLTADEWEQARTDPKLQAELAPDIIRDPAGSPRFFFARLAYSPEAEAIFAAERAQRRRAVDSTLTLDGSSVRIRHPRLDSGSISEVFDGNRRNVVRTLDANPTDLRFSFAAPRSVSGLRLHLWAERYLIEVHAIRTNGEMVKAHGYRTSGIPLEALELFFDEPVPDVVRLEMRISKGGDAHIHMREIEILP